jgi:nifR3 family TIM-barrel protein
LSTTSPFAFDLAHLRIDPACVLAPMEGITDRSFRTLIRGLGGCGLTVTEFVSSEAMSRHVAKAWRMAELAPDEHPVSIQIYGRDPGRMGEAARFCEELGADIVDINLGCPSKTVTSGCAGSALMREPTLAQRIFASVKSAIGIPMTVKMRLGWDRECLNSPEVAHIAQEEGAAMVTVHGRTRMDFYKGAADWSAVGEVKRRLRVPVLVNGDILTIDDADRALAESGCDGVMVGRGTMRDPWILRAIADHRQGRPPYLPTLDERRDVLLRYFDLIRQDAESDDRRALGKLKKVSGYFTRGLPWGARLREMVYRSTETEAVYSAVHEYFELLASNGLRDGFARVFADPSQPYQTQDSRRLERSALEVEP